VTRPETADRSYIGPYFNSGVFVFKTISKKDFYAGKNYNAYGALRKSRRNRNLQIGVGKRMTVNPRVSYILSPGPADTQAQAKTE